MTPDTDRKLIVNGVTKSFGGFRALSGVGLEVSQGDRLGIIGPNGSGKTTLMNCISGALCPDSGRVILRNVDVTQAPAHVRARLGIARSFQIPRPFRDMTALENLLVPLRYASRVKRSQIECEEAAAKLLGELDLDGHVTRLPSQMSQVQLRKLELARALASDPQILISDEAMAGLSHSEVDEVLDVLNRVSSRGVAVIMIEHIMRAISSFSNRLICMQAGQVIASGSVADVMSSSQVRMAYLGT
jgi:branched-chain amino acid transport system ATP-binding protein